MESSIQLVLSKMDELLIMAGAKIQGFYPYILRQQYVWGGMWIVATIACLTVLVLSILYIGKRGDSWSGDNFLDAFSGVMMFISAVVLIVAIVGTFAEGIPKLINPHFYAVKELMQMIEGVIPK